MNSAFVLSAYFAMVLSPCFVATYGDLLSFRWMVHLAQRRRAHAAERFMVSFHHARYSMAVVREAAFAAVGEELLEAPRPFLVPRHSIPMDSAAFAEARQRIAARVAQIAVAQQLRNAAAAQEKEKAAANTADVPARTASANQPIPAVATSRTAQPAMPYGVPEWAPGYAFAMAKSPSYWSWEDFSPPPREFAEAAIASPPSRSVQVSDPVPPRRRKPGESGAFEIAA